jgi:hypothetical protein
VRTLTGPVQAADWPAAAEAGHLLAALGTQVTSVPGSGAALAQGNREVVAPPATVALDWQRSGVVDLTGRPDGPPLMPRGRAATVARAAGLAFELITGVQVDGAAVLAERASIMGLARHGRTSCGGGTGLLRCADAWFALNLSRDADLVPALVEGAASEGAGEEGDLWPAIERWAGKLTSRQVLARATLLGMAAAVLEEVAAPGSGPWLITAGRPAGRVPRARPRVVNLGALWAGPLAARLLGRAGAEVVHVESARRREPGTSRDFYEFLRAGSTVTVLDFTDTMSLRRLLAEADVVIESSRPRALEQLRCSARHVQASGGPHVWLRIRGHADPARIAFGDDAAVAGGLVADDADGPVFAGDAIADPLAGLLGALAVAVALRQPVSSTIDLYLSSVAAYCTAPP